MWAGAWMQRAQQRITMCVRCQFTISFCCPIVWAHPLLEYLYCIKGHETKCSWSATNEAHAFQGAPTEQTRSCGNSSVALSLCWGTREALPREVPNSDGRKGQMSRVLWECLCWPLHPCRGIRKDLPREILTQEGLPPCVSSQDSPYRLEQPWW